MWVLNKICGICATNYSIHLKLTQKINPNASAFTNISQCTRIPQFAASFNSLNALLAESVPFVCCKLKNYITPSGTIEHMYARYTHTHARRLQLFAAAIWQTMRADELFDGIRFFIVCFIRKFYFILLLFNFYSKTKNNNYNDQATNMHGGCYVAHVCVCVCVCCCLL